MYHPANQPVPIEGILTDSSLKLLTLVNSIGTFAVCETGAGNVIATGSISQTADGRWIGPAYTPLLSLPIGASFPYTAGGITHTALAVVGRYYTVVVNGSVALVGAIKKPVAVFRLVPSEFAAGVLYGAVSSFGTGLVMPNSAGVTTLLERLTEARALLLDNLDAKVSSRNDKAPLTSTTTQTVMRAVINELFMFATDGVKAHAVNLPDDYMRSGAVDLAGMDALEQSLAQVATKGNAEDLQSLMTLLQGVVVGLQVQVNQMCASLETVTGEITAKPPPQPISYASADGVKQF